MPVQLVRVLQQLAGEYVTIELKNNTVISGTIIAVDPQMNTHLKNVKITVKGRNPMELEHLSVKGGTIRFYLLPAEVNLDHLLNSVSASNNQLKASAKGANKPFGKKP